ncbi:MAG: transcription elongation factor GreA [Dehalococcoidia bacterium]
MSDTTLGEAVSAYIDTLKGAARQAAVAELNRFSRWYGSDKPLGQMRGHDVATYGEAMGPSTPETSKRAEQVRGFFVYLKKLGILDQNLGPHLRLKKSTRALRSSGAPAPTTVELTQDGIDSLNAELVSLMEQRIAVREDIRKAMLDKDFKENSPLDAAKDHQGHIEARIRDIESMLKRAVVVEATATGRVRVGSSVRVTNLSNGRETQYAIVGPTEANAADGKISSVSPVGKALLDATAGDEFEVSVPAGVMKLRVESIGD